MKSDVTSVQYNLFIFQLKARKNRGNIKAKAQAKLTPEQRRKKSEALMQQQQQQQQQQQGHLPGMPGMRAPEMFPSPEGNKFIKVSNWTMFWNTK
jgi:transcription initiation factor TFIID subunit TAF12